MDNLEQEKKELYKVFWSGEDVSAEYLSEYYKNELERIKHENGLMGEFKASGKYVFSPEVKRGLIAIKKKIEDKKDNTYLLISKTTQTLFSFKMRIFEVEGQKDLLAANLYLIEIVDDERMEKSLITFVAQYVDLNNDEFINKVKYMFNISVDGEFAEYEKKENESIILPLLPAYKVPAISQEEIDKNYVERMLEELENCGDIGKKILDAFKLKTKTEKEDQKISFTLQRKMLNAIIEKNKAMPLLVSNTSVVEIIKTYNDHIKAIKTQEKTIEPFKEKVEEEKKEDKAKSAGASKPASKKASGGKPAKKEKAKANKIPPSKKDDKKKKDKKKDSPYKDAVAVKKKEIEIAKIELNIPKTEPVKKTPKVISTIKTKVPLSKGTPKQKLQPKKEPVKEEVKEPKIEEEKALTIEDLEREWEKQESLMDNQTLIKENATLDIDEKKENLSETPTGLIAEMDILIATESQSKTKKIPNMEKII